MRVYGRVGRSGGVSVGGWFGLLIAVAVATMWIMFWTFALLIATAIWATGGLVYIVGALRGERGGGWRRAGEAIFRLPAEIREGWRRA